MDAVSAKQHLEKMGADSWMKVDKKYNVIHQLEKTERLARFLSEIENAMHEKGFPEETVSSPQKLKSHEKQIVSTINRLLGAVRNGDPVTGEATQIQNEAKRSDTATQKKLMSKMMKSVDKENKASIIQAAGAVAERQIHKVIHEAGKDMKAKEKQIEKRKPKPLPKPAVMPSNKNDVVVPLSELHDRVVKTVSKALSFISGIFKKRKAAHAQMSVRDYQDVNTHLRSVAAHLMERYAKKDELRPFRLKVPFKEALTMPLRKAAWMRKQSAIDQESAEAKEYKKYHGRNPIHVGLTLPLKQARKVLKQSPKKTPLHVGLTMPLNQAKKAFKKVYKPHKKTAAKKTTAKKTAKKVATTKRDPVSQFVWRTLRQKEIKRDQRATSLAGLLERGVKFGNGVLHFAVPQ